MLQDPRLAGRSLLIKLAALVVLAKAPSSSAVVTMPYRDVGGWLGCSVSHVGHTVVPALKGSAAVLCAPKRSAGGRTEAVRLELLPLREARAAVDGSPLALLSKRELATLLFFLEAVTCPGWDPKGKTPTPPGFMAWRRERDAAADRLVMVLLCLEARRDGRVRMAPGRLPRGFRRADVTVARLAGCEVAVAAAAVDRLVSARVLELEREKLPGGGRLRVPAVADAHVRARRSSSHPGDDIPPPTAEEPGQEAGSCARCAGAESAGEELVLAGEGWAQESLEDALLAADDVAFGDQAAEESVKSQVSVGSEGASDESACAELHADHAPVVSLSASSVRASECFSGSAVGYGSDRQDRARAREGSGIQPSSAVRAVAGGPLRGDKPDRTNAGGGAFGRGTLVFSGPTSLPMNLRKALGPVGWQWSKIAQSSTRTWLAGRVRGEVGRLRGLVGEERAQLVVSERLERRLNEQRSSVADFVGWLLKRGLPQRRGCWSLMCDDGVRMDTRGPCDSCRVLVDDRRGLRRAVADQVLHEQLSGQLVLAKDDMARVVELRLQEAVRKEMDRKAAALGQAVAEQGAREARYEKKRQQAAEAQWARSAAPCADCGVPEAAGLCPRCANRRRITAALEHAVDYALVLRMDPDDALGTRELRRSCAAETRSVLEKRLEQLRRQGLEEAAVADTGRRLIEELRDRRRKAALARLGQEEEPAFAARVAAAAKRRQQRHPDTAEARAAVAAAGEAARRRVAARWMGELLTELRAVCSPESAAAVPRDWAALLPELASRALPHDTAGGAGAAGTLSGAVRERVNA